MNNNDNQESIIPIRLLFPDEKSTKKNLCGGRIIE